MKRYVMVFVLFAMCLSATLPVFGQRRAPIRSPEIGSNGQVTFRLQFADANSIDLAGQWPNGTVAMTKGEDNDVWTATVDAVPPGVWEYSFRVNGVAMIDPGNSAIKPMRSPRTSILHIPSQPAANYDFQEVAHGAAHWHDYQSKSLGRLRQLVVYTPPGYGQDASRKYPTLYLQHGSGDNHATWTVHGKAHWVFDNLLAQQRMRPMVVVMMDGHAAPPEDRSSNTEMFERDLLEDVMPLIEATYRVHADAAQRAIVGLSMGGGQSLTVGLKHADLFGWVGGFSSAVPNDESVAEAFADPAATNERLRLLWIACGKDDFLRERNEAFVAKLTDAKIKHEWHLTEGDHSWPVWRNYLSDFAPKLFQE